MKLMFIMIKIGVPAVMAVCLSCCSGHTAGGGNELKCRVMEVEGGYGYVVLHGADTLIYQPFIPALSGRLPFATKVEALAAGRLVCRKPCRWASSGIEQGGGGVLSDRHRTLIF